LPESRPTSALANRVCFVHIGTHKTGTTSLQTFLHSNQEWLQSFGIFIPHSCRPFAGSVGHHNLAWELNNDSRFDRSFGTLSQLIEEIGSVNSPTVCLTSEDFEYLHERPNSMRLLCDKMAGIGYNTNVIVYLRSQADYIESLYAELVKHDLTIGFVDFVQQIISTKVARHRKIWRFAFDYERLLDPFSAIFGEGGIIVRPYLAEKSWDCLIRDFMNIIFRGAEVPSNGYTPLACRQNVSINFLEVMQRYLANNLNQQGEAVNRRVLAEMQASVVGLSLCSWMSSPFDLNRDWCRRRALIELVAKSLRQHDENHDYKKSGF
jgi:hypothetical protein